MRPAQQLVLTSLGGGVFGLIQWKIITPGMRAAASAKGLAGVGVGAKYAAVLALVTVVLFALITALLRFRPWALAAFSAGLLALLLVITVWPFGHQVRLVGDSRAATVHPIAAAATGCLHPLAAPWLTPMTHRFADS